MNGICSGTDDDDGGEGGSSGGADVSQLFLFFSFFSFSFFFVDGLVVVFSPIYTSREDLCLCVIVNVIVTSHQLTFAGGVEVDFSLAEYVPIFLRDDSIESERET